MLQKMVWELLENSGGKISFSLFIKVAKGVLQDGCSEHFGKPSKNIHVGFGIFAMPQIFSVSIIDVFWDPS